MKHKLTDGSRRFPASIEDLMVGQGMIIEENGNKVAIYRKSETEFIRNSPKCSHLGCLIEWNTSENNWTCPCHGSQFTPDGKVIHGPAKKDLLSIS